MDCRPDCAACCIAASINTPLPGMPQGKPAGTMCVNLDPASRRCRIWGRADYPLACRLFVPALDVCGESREEAIRLIDALEQATL